MSREGSAAGIGLEALRTGRRSVPSAAWTDLNSMPSNRSKGKDVPAPRSLRCGCARRPLEGGSPLAHPLRACASLLRRESPTSEALRAGHRCAASRARPASAASDPERPRGPPVGSASLRPPPASEAQVSLRGGALQAVSAPRLEPLRGFRSCAPSPPGT